MINFFIYVLLIALCLIGVSGLFLFREYIKKISSLSIAYSSFVILIVLLSLKSPYFNEVLLIMVSIVAVFSVNLLTGIGIVKNITRSESKNQKKQDLAEYEADED